MGLPKPVSKADQDPVLQQNLDSLREQAAAEATAVINGKGSQWMMPVLGDWKGSLFDLQGIEGAFDRKFSNEKFVEATKDPSQPGTTSDLIATTLQVDYLSVMERSFRARHTTSRARAMLHAMGRKKGHGHPRGPLTQSVLEHIRSVINAGKR